MPDTLSLGQAADQLAEALDADVILFNGPIQRHTDRQLINDCTARNKRKNVLLLLVTMGGDADSAYRIARCLQSNYERFFLYVSGFCKSAGTLVALGAHELVMSDHGELGPLDVQLFKKDEIGETQSGLTVMYTLSALRENALTTFDEFFLSTKRKFGGTITLRTASQIATEMTTGLFAPLCSQIDPLYVGEASMAMLIAGHYGRRLLFNGQNIDAGKLNYILTAYPSHGIVIDRNEARELFRTVREPTSKERLLEEKLGIRARWPGNLGSSGHSLYQFLSTEQSMTEREFSQEHQEEENHAKHGDAAGPGSGDAAEAARKQHTEDNGERDTVTELDTARHRRSSK